MRLIKLTLFCIAFFLLFIIIVLVNNLESFGWYNQQYQPKKYELTRLDSNKLLTLVQEWRETNFLPEYSVSNDLCNLADTRVKQIQSDFSHKLFKEHTESYGFSTIGENLGEDSSEQSMLNGWLLSASHSAALHDNYSHTCIKCDGRYCVHLFGR